MSCRRKAIPHGKAHAAVSRARCCVSSYIRVCNEVRVYAILVYCALYSFCAHNFSVFEPLHCMDVLAVVVALTSTRNGEIGYIYKCDRVRGITCIEFYIL